MSARAPATPPEGRTPEGGGTSSAEGVRPEPDPGRDETPLQRLDRNHIELLNELRVAATGIQILFAFLLVAPFDQRFKELSRFERDEYFGSLLCIAVATALLIAPSVHHRLLFRHHEKAFLVGLGNRLLIIAMAFVAVGMTGIVFLIADLLFGPPTATVVGVLIGAIFGGLWFALPLVRRATHRDSEEASSGRGGGAQAHG